MFTQYLENSVQIYNVKPNKNETERRHPCGTYVTVIDVRMQALSYSHMTLSCCFVTFGLTTNTDEMYKSFNQSTKFAYRTLQNMDSSVQQCKNIRCIGTIKNMKSKVKTDDRERES